MGFGLLTVQMRYVYCGFLLLTLVSCAYVHILSSSGSAG